MLAEIEESSASVEELPEAAVSAVPEPESFEPEPEPVAAAPEIEFEAEPPTPEPAIPDRKDAANPADTAGTRPRPVPLGNTSDLPWNQRKRPDLLPIRRLQHAREQLKEINHRWS